MVNTTNQVLSSSSTNDATVETSTILLPTSGAEEDASISNSEQGNVSSLSSSSLSNNDNSGTTTIDDNTSDTTINMNANGTNNNVFSSHHRPSQRSRNNSLNGIYNFYMHDFYFDPNTFKQIKRLYCGMLLVAIAYSVTIILMMIVFYKSIPGAVKYSALLQNSFRNNDSDSVWNFSTSTTGPHIEHPSPITLTSVASFRKTFENNQTIRTTRIHLDQVIAVNFLNAIIYLMAFYAAQKEFYNLTLIFTTTLAVSMMISVVKILSEGTHFPNNLVALLLRMSIVFVALTYCSMMRRKQQFIIHANRFWLNNSNQSNGSTTNWINEIILGTSANTNTSAISNNYLNSSNKTDEHLICEYKDQPPNYEEALRCPMPFVRSMSEEPLTDPFTASSQAAITSLPTYSLANSQLNNQTSVRNEK